MRAGFVLALFLSVTPAIAAVPSVESKMYDQGRKELLAQGWEPYQTADSDCANSATQVCQQFPEIRFCSANGACQMTWRKGEETITVDTFGDFNDIQQIREGVMP